MTSSNFIEPFFLLRYTRKLTWLRLMDRQSDTMCETTMCETTMMIRPFSGI